MPIVKQCAGCGQDFSVIPSEAERKKFCSMNCRRRRVRLACARCGGALERPARTAAHSAEFFCSKKCRYGGATDEERFWSKVQRGDDDACWEWHGCRAPNGYGQCRFRGRNTFAHRVAYLLATGVAPGKGYVLHSCDNRTCVNPSHLRLGTHEDNMADMTSRRRQASGTRHGQARLNRGGVIMMRLAVANGATHQAVGRAFGVTKSTVGHIVRRKIWRHV